MVHVERQKPAFLALRQFIVKNLTDEGVRQPLVSGYFLKCPDKPNRMSRL